MDECMVQISESEYRRLVMCECVVKMLGSYVGNDDYISPSDLKRILRAANM